MERVRQFLQATEPVKWLFYGDSITHGAVHTWGARDYTELFAERVRGERGRSEDVVINTAISGNTTRELLQGFDWRVRQFRPDVVFLMIGMNDCAADRNLPVDEFEQNLVELASLIDEQGGLCVFQTTCPVLPGAAPEREPHFEAYMERIRSVAAGRRLPLVDHARFWAAYADRHYFWMSNAFHPNGFGHVAFARHLFEVLGILDAQSPVCRLFVP
jgi:lysophospholipase L1-like esterase